MHTQPISLPHTYQLRVYYEDTDAGGIVYHAGYLRFAERARTEALRAAGAAHSDLVAEHGLAFVVRRLDMRYLRPARLDDAVSVTTETIAIGGATATLRQSFQGPAGDLGVLNVELACIRVGGGKDDGKPARMPERWRAALCNGKGRAGVGAEKEQGA